MRKLNLISGVLGLAALGLTACSNEMPVQSEPQKAEADETRYISVQICAPKDAVTRALGSNGFENGATNESYINTLDFLFFDAAGNPTAKPVYMSKTAIDQALLETKDEDGNVTKEPTAWVTDNPTGGNITRMFTTVVPADLTQGQNLPSQVICIVNGDQGNIAQLKSMTLTQLRDYQRSSFRTDNNFTMSNSVYYGTDVLTGQPNERLCATPINTNTQLFGTEKQAFDALKDNKYGTIVDIYVERLAAKVGLNMAVSNATGGSIVAPYSLSNGMGTTGNVTITFEPTYWSVNATDKSVYMTKRYGVDDNGIINKTPDYEEINSALTAGGFSNWNAPEQYRSYWGTSPSYFENNYPDVSDDVDDLENNKGSYDTYYYTYKDIEDEAKKTNIGAQAIAVAKLPEDAEEGATLTNYFATTTTTEGNTTTSSGYIYTRETTVAKDRINDIDDSNPAAAVASAVIVGKYKINAPEGTALEEDGTFFVDRRNMGNGGTFYGTEAAAKNALVNRQSIVYTRTPVTDAEGTVTGYQYNALDAASTASTCFELRHPSKAVRDQAGTKLAGRLVTIQITTQSLTALGTTTLYYYQYNADGTGAYTEINNGNLTDVNVQLMGVGYMDKFYQGLAFFSIPIRHLNWNDDWYTQANGYNWAAMQSGSLGVVRNHVYNITVSGIAGLGSALRSDEQPIVSAKEEATQYIAARLNILAWNIVNSWTVSL